MSPVNFIRDFVQSHTDLRKTIRTIERLLPTMSDKRRQVTEKQLAKLKEKLRDVEVFGREMESNKSKWVDVLVDDHKPPRKRKHK